jgi:hypothetical protein
MTRERKLQDALQTLYDAVACSHQPFFWDKTIKDALRGAEAALKPESPNVASEHDSQAERPEPGTA